MEEIRVDVYDQHGSRVFRGEVDDAELIWHTVNDAGELLANGMYLYNVSVRIAGIWYPLAVEKLAIVR